MGLKFWKDCVFEMLFETNTQEVENEYFEFSVLFFQLLASLSYFITEI